MFRWLIQGGFGLLIFVLAANFLGVSFIASFFLGKNAQGVVEAVNGYICFRKSQDVVVEELGQNCLSFSIRLQGMGHGFWPSFPSRVSSVETALSMPIPPVVIFLTGFYIVWRVASRSAPKQKPLAG